MSSVNDTINFVFNSLSELRHRTFVPEQPTTSSSRVYPAFNNVNDENDVAPNLLSQLSPNDTKNAKSIFLTLHFLFPHELLPALDLLDRKLVTTLRLGPDHKHEVFYVQSASAQSNNPSHLTARADKQPRYYDARRKAKATDTYYEVRLDSWNCSCAGFAFDGFKGLDVEEGEGAEAGRVGMGTGGYGRGSDDGGWRSSGGEDEGENDAEKRVGDGTKFVFGGWATKKTEPVPICKHILAAALMKAAPELFGRCVKVREVSNEEIAGWGAGYGDHG